MVRSLTMEEMFYIGIVNLLENEELMYRADNEHEIQLFKGAAIGIRMFLCSLGYKEDDIQYGIEAVQKGEVSLDFMKKVENLNVKGLH